MAKKQGTFTARSVTIAAVAAFVLGILAAGATYSILNNRGPSTSTDTTSMPVSETTSSPTTATAAATATASPTSTPSAGSAADTQAPASDAPSDAEDESGESAAPLSSIAPATWLKQAAAKGEYKVYAPSWLPAGFKVDEGASSALKGRSTLILGKGDSRIAIIQGAWDPGGLEPAAIDPAQWDGGRQASLLIDVPYLTDRAPYRGRNSRMLIHQDSDGLHYAVVGVDVPVSDLRKTALSMKALNG